MAIRGVVAPLRPRRQGAQGMWLRDRQSRTGVGIRRMGTRRMRGFRDSDGREGSAVAPRSRQSVPAGRRGLRQVLAPAWPGGRNSGPLLPAPPHSAGAGPTPRPAGLVHSGVRLRPAGLLLESLLGSSIPGIALEPIAACKGVPLKDLSPPLPACGLLSCGSTGRAAQRITMELGITTDTAR